MSKFLSHSFISLVQAFFMVESPVLSRQSYFESAFEELRD